jgi:hypothetical protein
MIPVRKLHYACYSIALIVGIGCYYRTAAIHEF